MGVAFFLPFYLISSEHHALKSVILILVKIKINEK